MRRNPIYNPLPARLLSLLATGLLLLPLMVFPLRQIIFLSQSAEIRKLGSQSERLETLVFTAEAYSHLAFERHQRELLYQGNMYDVHSITTAGDRVVVLALRDTRESRLLLAFQYQEKTDGSSVPGVTKVGFIPYFCIETFRPDLHAPAFDRADYLNIRFIYSDPFARILSPPPELLTSI